MSSHHLPCLPLLQALRSLYLVSTSGEDTHSHTSRMHRNRTTGIDCSALLLLGTIKCKYDQAFGRRTHLNEFVLCPWDLHHHVISVHDRLSSSHAPPLNNQLDQLVSNISDP